MSDRDLLFEQLAHMNNLPAPSSHVMKIMLLLRDEEVDVDELIDLLERDHSLVAQVLKLVNSGYYGLRKSVDTVSRAVNLLGILNVKQVVYSASIIDMFTKEEELEWKHAYSTSVLMSHFMNSCRLPIASNLTLTMLMHDLGKVVLRRYDPKKYQESEALFESGEMLVAQAEREVYGIDHAELGGWLLERWKVSEDILTPILYHHSQELPESLVIETAAVQFVNWIDCGLRGINCIGPTVELIEAAGIDVDIEHWLNFHRGLINTIEGEDSLKDSSTVYRALHVLDVDDF